MWDGPGARIGKVRRRLRRAPGPASCRVPLARGELQCVTGELRVKRAFPGCRGAERPGGLGAGSPGRANPGSEQVHGRLPRPLRRRPSLPAPFLSPLPLYRLQGWGFAGQGARGTPKQHKVERGGAPAQGVRCPAASVGSEGSVWESGAGEKRAGFAGEA